GAIGRFPTLATPPRSTSRPTGAACGTDPPPATPSPRRTWCRPISSAVVADDTPLLSLGIGPPDLRPACAGGRGAARGARPTGGPRRGQHHRRPRLSDRPLPKGCAERPGLLAEGGPDGHGSRGPRGSPGRA